LFHLLQTLLISNQTALPALTNLGGKQAGFWQNPILVAVLYFIAVLLFLAALMFLVRYLLTRRQARPASLRKIILLVTLPKEVGSKEKQPEKPLRELIDEAEAMFSSLGGMRAQRGLEVFFTGRTDHFSLEIAAYDGLISFYVVVPAFLRTYTEEQIHSQYPKANIEEVEDYNIFTPESQIVATSLRFKKSYIFPIKTYRLMDVDPLSSLTNVLSKIPKGEGAVIQYIVRSAKAQWHGRGAGVAKKMHEGKNLKEAQGVHGVNAIFSNFASIFFPKKKKEEMDLRPNFRVSPRDEEIAKSLEEKTSRAGMDVNIRLIVSAKTKERALALNREIVNAFSQYNLYEYGNGLVKRNLWTPWSQNKLVMSYIYRMYNERHKLILNSEEMASLFHFPLESTETPNIRWLLARKAPAPVNLPSEGIILGQNIFRGEKKLVRLKRDDRRRHVYMIGMTGSGKSVLMQEMVKQDIRNGDGVCVIDPHGGLVEDILACIPKERAEDVVLFEPSDVERPVGLNMLEATSPEEADFAVQEMIAIFYKLFPPEMIGPMFEHNMRNVMLTLMADKEYPGTIADIPRMFTDKAYQEYKLKKVTDPVVRSFWEKEMAKTTDFHKSEMLGYLISKVGRFVENQMMRNIIGQPHSGFNFREVMDKQKVLLVNLSKGKTGEVNSNLLGLILVSKLQMAALARADMPESERKDFYLYIDEFQNFITPSIATILSEARKYKLNLIMAHQYLGQLTQGQNNNIRDAVLGNVGTLIAFRIGVEDAEIIARQLDPVFSEYDVVNIARFNAYIKLLIDNATAKAFNIATFPPTIGNPLISKKIRELSRLKYGRSRIQVEAELMERTKLGEVIKTPFPSSGEKNI